MSSTLWLDTETYNEVPLKHGTYRYAETAEVMLVSWAIDDGPSHVWDVTSGAPIPLELWEPVEDPGVIVKAHNSMFDRNVLRKGNLQINIPIERWHCTMAQALAHSLPGKLEQLGPILGVREDAQKMKEGKALVMLFCKPRPKSSKVRRATRETNPEEWAKFVEYSRQDVVAMREIAARLPTWNYKGAELALHHLDQRINDRGMCIDVDFARAAVETVKKEQARLAVEVRSNTQEQVQSATQRDVMLRHILSEYGIDLPDLTKDTLQRRIDDPDLPSELRELLSLRLEASTSSTSKYTALVRGVSSNGRLSGTLQFCGANRTARWAGRLFQPQNLPRPVLEAIARWFGVEVRDLTDEMFAQYINDATDSIKLAILDLISDDVMAHCSNLIRSAIIAPHGYKLRVADFANIEGRKAAWLAGEAWKLDAFRDYDNGRGADLYKVAYARSFRVEPGDVTKSERQVGKVMELMLQYEGGVGAFVTGAATYGIDLEVLADRALSTIPNDVFDEAENFYEWAVEQKRPTFGLSKAAFVVCDSLKRLWRRAHPQITSMWPELKEAFTAATCNPGKRYVVRGLVFQRDGAWLRIRLPSGRQLCYPQPKVHEDGRVSYMGVNQYTRKWQRVYTYGGKLLENITQASSRDVLREGMFGAEEDAHGVVLTAHDEIVDEVPDSPHYSVERLVEIMSRVPDWAQGLPLAVAGYETYRYRKEL